MNIVLGFLSALAILYTTLGSRSVVDRELALAPFATFWEAKLQPELYRSLLMNVLLFEPLGLSLSQGLPCSQPRFRFLLTVLLAFGFSCTVEISQYLFFLGRTETDDVIMNTLGASFGALSLPINSCLQRFTLFFHDD